MIRFPVRISEFVVGISKNKFDTFAPPLIDKLHFLSIEFFKEVVHEIVIGLFAQLASYWSFRAYYFTI